MTKTQTPAELTEEGIQILCREMGPTNALRFIRQITNGAGDSVAEREQQFGDVSVDEIYDAILKRRTPQLGTGLGSGV